MIKLLNIIGARPQIIKAAAISRAIRDHFSDRITDVILHTGQHYDSNMSGVFIDELLIPEPLYNLKVGSKSHGKQTAEMITGLEEVLEKEQPEYVLAYGDTNSTLAAAVATVKMGIPLVHIEAGMRSFTKLMPEEVNRVLCDHSSSILFSPTPTGIKNLIREGFKSDTMMPWSINNPGIIHCGDIMYDNSMFFSSIAEKSSQLFNHLGIDEQAFNLATIHRPMNTDDPIRLRNIFEAIIEISDAEEAVFVIPLHPRTSGLMEKELDKDFMRLLGSKELIKIIEPVSFLDMILLEKHANVILTDSGGVQKEAYFFNKPCIILRNETEWVEIIEHGAGRLAGSDKSKILQYYAGFMENKPSEFPPIFGDGRAATTICDLLVENFEKLSA